MFEKRVDQSQKEVRLSQALGPHLQDLELLPQDRFFPDPSILLALFHFEFFEGVGLGRRRPTRSLSKEASPWFPRQVS